jgi:hypothetical protein
VFLADPVQQEHLVVGAQAEQDREQQDRDEVLQVPEPLEAQQPGTEPVLEDHHQHPVGGAE